MKQQTFKRHLWLLLLTLLIPMAAWADREISQLQLGKQTIEVASDEVITFYEPWGTENVVDNNSYNSQSLTVFKPAEAGKSVQITFEKIDLDQYSNSYYLYVNLYDGIADADDSFNWPSSTSAITSSSSLAGMSGTLIAEKINNGNKPSLPAVYTSGTADGALSVGFMHRNSNECEGWVAKVKVVTLENMTITGAGSNYDGIGGQLSTKQNVALANAFVTATGVMNPDNVTAICFTMTKNEGVVDPTALKLFKGDVQVAATVESDGDNYKFVLNEAPSDGTTVFTVTGDFLGTAAIGGKVQVDITKVTTMARPEGITPFTAGSAVEIENPALVFMTATPQTVTVTETPLSFFDEGGKDGGILSKTNGQVTFLSGAAGKKVMVNFTINKIWHGSLYNQELRIYAGQEVNAANLIKTLQQGETGIVRSTAEDGSLTVVLYSDASNSIEADGFEATVSLFVPQPMDFDYLVSSPLSSETVAAGDLNQDMLSVNVITQNTEPAMQVTKMAFNAGENFAFATKASLYFGSTKVGEADVTGANVVIVADEPQTLVEGENQFTLKYNISDEVLNDQVVRAELVSVTALVNGAEKTETPSESTPAERTVKNIVINGSGQGTVTKTVNGSMDFETKPASEYSTKYEYGTDDRINIFVPKHDGMVCQIDFASFAVYYASSSYGTHAKFEIYAGQGTTGIKLWELNDNAQQEVGPGTTIRSTAEDGALTIVFNPNASYSSYTLDGWRATVSEYQSKEMEVTALEATQTVTGDVSIGATEQELLTINVKTEGNLNALAVDQVKVNLKGSEANIAKVSVWKGESKLGEAAAAAEVEISFSEPATLAEGDNLFTLKADIKADATENESIDASLVSAHIGAADVPATAGDPEGARTLKNQVLLTAGNHGTLNLALGQKVNVYDDGGAEGDGADGVEATLTLAPAGEAESIKLTNLGITFAYNAHLYIYKGVEVNDDNLIVDLTGSSAKFDPIVSDADFEGGKLTLKYVGKGSYTKPNFGIVAEGYKKSDVVVTSVTTEDLSVSEVLKGQTDVRMLKIMVEAKGELTPAKVTSFNVSGIDGDAVQAYHIYQTGMTTTFSANEEFSGSYSITNSGTYYFWLTYDLKSDATVGMTAAATLNSIVVSGEAVDVTEPATANVTVASGKSGVYTVGEGGTYSTIQAAIDDFGTLGMEGPVVLKIKAGEYNEKVRVPYIKGMGATNTLTIESESGERDVKIYENNYTTGGYSDDQHKKDYGVITLYQASYVTLKNLEVYTTDKAYKAVVMVKDESRHVTIDNCYLHAPVCTANSGEDVCLIGHTIIDEENKNNDYLTVRNSLLEGGKMGVSMGGTNYVALPKEVGGIIEGNTFKNNGQKAIYVMDELGAKILGNTIVIESSVTTKISVGVLDMQLRDEYSVPTEIVGNTFNVAPTSYCAVMNIRQVEASAEAPMIIANNVINLVSLNASYSPFKFNGTKVKNVNVANNTIRMTGENGGAAFWASSKFDDGYGIGIDVVNNIIQNETNGYAVNLYNDANLGKINFRNNIMSAFGETFFRASSSTTGDFAAFVEQTGATGCINKQVTFVNDDILEPATTLDSDLLTAVKLDYVTTDVNGTARPEENISIGAYEYNPNRTRVPVIAEGYPTAAATAFNEVMVSVKADMAGKAYVVVLPATEEAPTAETVKASEHTAVLTKDTEAGIKIGGLSEKTTYNAYVLVESAYGVTTELQTVSDVTTPMEPIELMIACTEPETTVEEGTETSLKVMVASGLAPFTVTWKNQKNEQVGEPVVSELIGEEIVKAITPTQSGDYYVNIKDAQNFEANDTCRIIVTGEALAATFDDIYLAENSYWRGPDTKGDIEEGLWGDQQYRGSFLSGSYKFSNNYSIDWGSWSGFGYSNRTETEGGDIMSDQWNSCVGKGHNDSENYAVFYEDSFAPMTVSVLNNAEGDVISGFYITNAAVTVNAILNGDGMTPGAFTTGDFLKLIITADEDDAKTVEYYLADYTSENEADHYYVNDWQWVDLSSLGTVEELSFHMESSRTNAWGYTTPLYFCMDDFNGQRPETVKPEAEAVIDGEESDVTVEAGAEVELTALVNVDTHAAPYTLTWMDQKHNVLKSQVYNSVSELEPFVANTTPTECTDYIFIVTDAAEKADTATVRAYVLGDAVTATFETLYLPEESFERGDNLNGSFVCGSYKFDNGAIPEWYYYYDYMYANRTTTSFSFDTYSVDQFNNAVGGGVNGSENYLVAYPQGGRITVMNNSEGDVLNGFYITNDAWTVDNIVNGDGMSSDGGKPFGQGDYFKLIITADNSNSVEYYLADYRAEEEADRYYVNTWQWVDLRPLGTVKSLSFTFESTKYNTYGTTTATYFCMDDFNGQRPETFYAFDMNTVSKSVSEAFDLADEGSVVYAFADALDESLQGIVSLNDDVLVVNTDESMEFDVVVKATQSGKAQYVKLHVVKSDTTGITDVEATENGGSKTYYNLSGQKVEKPLKSGIYIVNGQKVYVK